MTSQQKGRNKQVYQGGRWFMGFYLIPWPLRFLSRIQSGDLGIALAGGVLADYGAISAVVAPQRKVTTTAISS